MTIFDVQDTIAKKTNLDTNQSLIQRVAGGELECELPSCGEHDAETVVSDMLAKYGHTVSSFVEAVEDELGGKYVSKVGVAPTGFDSSSALIYYADEPHDHVLSSHTTELYSWSKDFDDENPEAKDIIEAALEK